MEEESRSREAKPVSRTASRHLAGIGIVAAAVSVIAVVAFLAFRGDSGGGSGLGLGSGPPELSGDWDIAVTQAAGEGAGVGRISLTEGDDGGLSGTGEVAFPDESMAMSVEGTVEEQESGGQTVNLASTDGSYQLRGTLSTDDSMEGGAVWTGSDGSGSFAAIRAGDVDGDSPRKAVSRYLKAWGVADGTTQKAFQDAISGSVVAPLYWSSPAGDSAREVSDKLNRSEKLSMDFRLVDFVASEEDEAEVSGTIRYRQDYRQSGEAGVFYGSVATRVVRWGDGYRVLYAGNTTPDPQAYLGGEWRVSTQNESEYFADPASSDLIFGGEGFVMTLDSFEPGSDGVYDIEGTADGLVVGPADVTGNASVADDGSLDVSLSLEAVRGGGGVHDLGLSGIELTDEGLEGGAVDNSTGAVSAPYADFVAVREGGKR